MDIMFEIVSKQRFSGDFTKSHVFGEAGGYIGRSDDCEWVLPDRSKKISRKHALISFEDGHFYLEDVSSNGIFLTLGREAVGKGNRHKIEHGEGFYIGDYSIMARLLHDPSGYVQPNFQPGETTSNFTDSLSLHPLEAIDQEEELIARQRMGEYDELLGTVKPPPTRQADHTDVLLTSIQPIQGIPQQNDIIPEDWDDEPVDDEPLVASPTQIPVPQPAAQPVPEAAPMAAPHTGVPTSPPPPVPHILPIMEDREADIFFKALGFPEPPSSSQEREKILRMAAELLTAAVQGLTQALHNRAVSKNELRLPVTITNLTVGNNPLKFSPTPEAALAVLLGPPQKGVLHPVEAIREGFADLHSHHLGLLAGARAAVRASLDTVSPEAVERRLDVNGSVRILRTQRLWYTFNKMHRQMHDDHDGFAGLFLQDFARAYEIQARTLTPHPTEPKGVK